MLHLTAYKHTKSNGKSKSCSQKVVYISVFFIVSGEELHNGYQIRITQAFASVFQRFFHTVHANNGLSDIHSMDDLISQSKSDNCIFLDDYSSKVAAWKGSLHLMKQILHIDTEITSGENQMNKHIL